MDENTFAPEESTEVFGSNSLEENSKLAEKLTETGFNSIKEPLEEIAYDKPEDAEMWKYRYYKLLEVINTFKGSNYE